ncbi:MAG: rhomboid family intramembrane serine protease [Planctomycetes bacterium]|nr:rhomboid family intramembrane serine protease [Planctomycetota bacterium]
MARPSFDDGDFGGAGMQMRSVYPPLTPALKRLLIANGAIFLFSFLLSLGSEELYGQLLHWFGMDVGLWRENAPFVPVWQLLSYGFLHSTTNLMHIVMNMITLYFFGMMLEQELGARRFLITYFASQVLGGLFFLVLALATGIDSLMIGASGACFGVMVAAATLWPRRPVILYFVPLTLRTLALIFVGIEVFSFLLVLKGGGSDGVSHITHLGGIVYGYFAVRSGLVYWDPVGAWGERRATKAVESAAADDQRMDQLLEKIHREGMASLSKGEREFLKRVSSRR